jgi:N6-L-threonylcarbamoyladenine synthase
MKILGIETSCDETAVALVEGKGERVVEKESLVASSQTLHAKTGGIVPEVAAREHVGVIVPLLQTMLGTKRPKIDAIAVTAGPGLFSSLLVGVETAKALSYAWGVPLVRVNHIEGHVYSSSIAVRTPICFPALALVVSGGHTELILMRAHGKYKLIGRTRDDAAGEAFDKTAQMLGLGYPGGPAIAKAALTGDATAFSLPRPMMHGDNFDFSFAGLKTAALYATRDPGFKIQVSRNDMAASIQEAIVEVLVAKTLRAAKKYSVNTVLLGGGVAANDELRGRLQKEFARSMPFTDVRIPQKKYTTDNAVMIAAAGYFHAKAKKFTAWNKIAADPNWELV